jgi:hypothetical protein
MTKEQIIKLYIADLNNLVADSDAKRNRIIDLEYKLRLVENHDTTIASLTSDSVSKSFTTGCEVEGCNLKVFSLTYCKYHFLTED